MRLGGLWQRPARWNAPLRYLATGVLSSSISLVVYAGAHAQKLSPGAMPFTPTRIDWLTTTLQASLRTENLQTDGFLLQITSPDPETILIYVRYMPTVNREVMNTNIDAARKVIQITARSYGWDTWLRVREDIQLVKSDKDN